MYFDVFCIDTLEDVLKGQLDVILMSFRVHFDEFGMDFDFKGFFDEIETHAPSIIPPIREKARNRKMPNRKAEKIARPQLKGCDC